MALYSFLGENHRATREETGDSKSEERAEEELNWQGWGVVPKAVLLVWHGYSCFEIKTAAIIQVNPSQDWFH